MSVQAMSGLICTRKLLSQTLMFMLASGIFSVPVTAKAQQSRARAMEDMEVIGVTPTHGVGLPEERIPYPIQTATDEDLRRTLSLDITDFMNRNLGSISINDAQNNPWQPDIQFRGFTASPLLGLPQGLAVYQNSVRINEVLGDTVNWDLIPMTAISSINLIGGANPLFGLNTLGGALSITTKNGFTHPGHSAEAYGGSFGRIVTSAESGGNNGTFGYYGAVQYFEEEGWRDASPSEGINFFSALSYRQGTHTSLDLNFTYGDTDLIGNGAAPVELLQQSRRAIFTSPDRTENKMYFIDLEGEHWLNDQMLLSGNIFYRNNKSKSFNGDISEFEECDPPFDGFLCEDDEPDDPIFDQFGNLISEDFEDAINNSSTRDQRNWGGSFQTTFLHNLFNRDNQLIVGAGYSQGFAEFFSTLEVAELNDDRSTTRTGIFVPSEGTFLDTRTRSWSIYLTDTISLTDKLDLTVSARYNNTRVQLKDQGGQSNLTEPAPELTGKHDYDRINPAVGVTYAFMPTLSGYASYSESSRAPTPIELACADPDAPCRLPNAFLADPPLEQVVSLNWEGGFRGVFNNDIKWHLGGFLTENKDDIIFISTGGATSNQGYFSNVGDTRRLGMELGLNGAWKQLDWFVHYTYVAATFETGFSSSSPNHPSADADGAIQVRPGDRIPGIPEHNLKIGGDYAFTPKFSVGADLLFNSGQYLRGDEANLLDPIDGYAIVNLRGRYQIHKNFSIFARVTNLFNTKYDTFGLLGEPDEVFPSFNNPRFHGPGAPRAGFVGVRLQF